MDAYALLNTLMGQPARPWENFYTHRNPLVVRAAQVATYAHDQQLRKYTGALYIQHPLEVAQLVSGVGGTDDQIAAALLHDVVEDTPIKLSDLAVLFPARVVDYVGWLTDVSKPSDGNRRVRKALDRKHTERAPGAVKTIKLADVVSNGLTIKEHDEAFAKVYLEEMRELLEVLGEGNITLFLMARTIIGSNTNTSTGETP